MVMPSHPDKIWPAWVHGQLNPDSPVFSLSGLPQSFVNQAYRNVTVLSTPGTDHYALVDPKGLLTPSAGSWSLDVWVAINGQLISPSGREKVHQRFNPANGSVTTAFTYGPLDVKINAFASGETVLEQVRIKNRSDAASRFSFFYAIRPYNSDGVAPVKEIVYLSAQAFVVNNQLGVVLGQSPDNVVCLSRREGDAGDYYSHWQMVLKTECPDSMASAFAEYRVSLAPGDTAEFSAILPMTFRPLFTSLMQNKLSSGQTRRLTERIESLRDITPDSAKEQVQASWKSVRDSLAGLTLPDQKLTLLFEQSVRHVFNTLGDSLFIRSHTDLPVFNIRDAVVTIRALNRLGAADRVDAYFRRQRQMLRNASLSAPADMAGQYLYILQDTFRFHRHKEMPATLFPVVNRLAERIRRQTRAEESAHLGVMAKSSSCDTAGYQDHYLWDAFWAQTGLQSAINMAAATGHEDKKSRLHFQEKQLKHYIDRFIDHMGKKTEQPSYLPAGATRPFDAGSVYSLAAHYPLGLIPADDDLISRTLTVLESRFYRRDLLFRSAFPSGFPTWQNAVLAHIYLSRRDEKAFSLLKWLTDVQSETGCWPETIHPLSGKGGPGQGFDSRTSADFLMLIRRMMIDEQEGSLHLFPFIPADWLPAEDQMLEIRHWPTLFGPFSGALTRRENGYELLATTEFHTTPEHTYCSLPVLIEEVETDGIKKAVNSRTVVLPSRFKQVLFKVALP